MPMNTVQSPEYSCPAGTLPTNAPTAPTAAPTQAPTYANNCVPGYLGLQSGGTPLLDDETFVNEEFGVFIIQQGDGNLIVFRGTPEARGELVWASGGILDGAEEFYSQVNGDGSLVTYVGTPEAGGQVIFSTADQAAETAKQEGSYFLGIDCNSEVVSVYAGSWLNLREAVSVWNSVPTSPPTAYPTKPPTTAPPTAAPEPTVGPQPTAAPTSISLTLGETKTSSATTASMCLSVVALLLVNAVLL
jgi:hypothetical protein